MNFNNFIPFGVLSIIPATSLLFVCFTGFEAIATISAEIKRPRRNIPKALFYTVGIVAIIYLLIVSAIVYSVNIDDLTGSEVALLKAVEFSPPMTVVIIICAAIAVLSSLNVALM
ncbi:unnamed protein product, partial [marine sediment metagenome]